MAITVKADWTGKFPSLCYGEWKLFVCGEDVSEKIPDRLRRTHMNTFGSYPQFHFEDGWNEVWESVVDGLEVSDWIASNNEWLSTITGSDETKRMIYYAIQEEDWRHCSCGGCI